MLEPPLVDTERPKMPKEKMLEIPGHYFDPEKRRYFKIEKTTTAPSWAAWSAEAVKKRKADDLAKEEAKYREHILRNHVKRSAFWDRDPVSTALLRSETGDLRRRGNQQELASVAWAQGLNRRGGVEFTDDHDHGRAAKMKGFWVGGEEDGLPHSVVYAPARDGIGRRALRTDADGSLGGFVRSLPGQELGRYEPAHVMGQSFDLIKCHTPSQWLVAKNSVVTQRPVVTLLAPGREMERHFRWRDTRQLRPPNVLGRVKWVVHSIAPAPSSASGNTIAAIATSSGVMRVTEERIELIYIRRRDEYAISSGDLYADSVGLRCSAPREIFDLTFHDSHPQLIIAAGREGKVLHTDLRTGEVDWSMFQAKSAVARIASVGPHGLLVSALESNLGLYDLRYTKRTREDQTAEPVVRYAGHKNLAHWKAALDVSEKLGVVAAAQDDGEVKLFNLRSGAPMSCPALRRHKLDNTPVETLMFKTVHGEGGRPSLFVGEEKGLVVKYSWGEMLRGQEGNEWEPWEPEEEDDDDSEEE